MHTFCYEHCKCISYCGFTSCSDIAHHLPKPAYAAVHKLQIIMLGHHLSGSRDVNINRNVTVEFLMNFKVCLRFTDNMKVLALVAVLVGVAAALPGLRLRRDSSPLRFELPSNASLVLGGITTGFDCADLPYGYYADTSNGCALFHVCLPYIDNNVYITRHFSFMCGEGTMFDQERLVCAFPEEALPCSEAAAFRRSNEYFGRSEVNFLE
ncbi:uncharacterized protein LOC134767094 [Penaeus indicus]|uniref:uncharacterized protein LOC134767094 n=1 Tax=Penaeus indicus TaxID=29960 RepID=UPI00300DB5E2